MMTKAGRDMRQLLQFVGGIIGLTVIAYWFNLDSKLVKAIEKPMMSHYDNMKRDHRL